MTETRKLELTKEGSELLKSGVITEEDFEDIKNNLFSESAHDYKEDFTSFKKVNELLEQDLIDVQEHNRLKKNILEGKKTKGLLNAELLEKAKRLCNNNYIGLEDYASIKEKLLFDSSNTHRQLYEENFKNIEIYHRYFDEGLIDENEYEQFKKTLVHTRKLKDAKEMSTLKDYKEMLDNGFITEEEHLRIRGDILSGKKNNNYSRPSFIKSLYKLKEKGYVAEEEFNSFKSAFIEGSPLPNDEAIKIVEKNTKYVESGLLNGDEFELIKDRAYGGADVLNEEKIQNITEYKKLFEEGTINEEEFCKFKKDILNIGANKTYVVKDAAEIKSSKKKTRTIITICCISIAMIVAIIYLGAKIPVWKSEKAVDNLVNESTALLDNAEYETVMRESSQISNKYKGYLSDENSAIATGLYFYAEALNDLDMENGKMNSDNPNYVKGSLEYASHYDVAQEMIDFINKYDGLMGKQSGVMTVDLKKYEKSKNKKTDVIEGTAYNETDAASNIFSHTAVVSGTLPSRNNANNDTTESDTDSEEEKEEPKEEPKEEEYSCLCKLIPGFVKKNKDGGLSKDNISKVFKLTIDVDDYEDVDSSICKEYEGVFKEEEASSFTIKAKDGSFEGMGELENGVINIDFGNGVTIKIPEEKEEEETYSSSNSSSSSSSNSSYNRKKDYKDGSDWEKYDSDSDGRINDKEFQDATSDYIDKYFEENGTGGDLNAYDYNGNSQMETREFQDAVNDYMDANGY